MHRGKAHCIHPLLGHLSGMPPRFPSESQIKIELKPKVIESSPPRSHPNTVYTRKRKKKKVKEKEGKWRETEKES